VIKFLLLDTSFEIRHVCFASPHQPQSNFKALFSRSNRPWALNDAIVLVAGRCHVRHTKANRLHAHGSACTLVAATQDVALERAATGTDFPPPKRHFSPIKCPQKSPCA